MKTIGITGGVGAGKSSILSFLEENYSCKVVRTDEVAHLLEQPGQKCYKELVDLMGTDILQEDLTIQKSKMAQLIFSDAELLEKVNQMIHPEVKQYVISEIEKERQQNQYDYFFVEAALLIEEHYDQILDELWYIHTDSEIRKKRLMESRHYSEEKVADIMRGQLCEEEFRKYCDVEIINNDDVQVAYDQIKQIMGE